MPRSLHTIIKLLVPFILGTIGAYYLQLDSLIVFTLWLTSITTLFILILTAWKVYDSRIYIGINLMVVFFFSGFLSTTLHHPESQPHNVANKYLPGDKLSVVVTELNRGKKFDKAVAEVTEVIKNKDTLYATGKIILYLHYLVEVTEIGEKLIVSSDLSPIKNKGNPGEFNQATFWKNNGITLQSFAMKDDVEIVGSGYSFKSFWYNLRTYLVEQMQSSLDESVYGLTTALALGDKSLLAKEDRDNFANAGAMHVLAVSGLHVGILLGIIQWLAGKIRFLQRRNRNILIAVICVWFFAFLTGLSPSVLRAAVMFSILAFGQARGISFFSINSLLVSALILLIIDPLLLFNIGFQLSYLAMLGIALFYQPISKAFYIKNKWLRKVWEGTALGIAAQIGTVPISIYYFHQFPNYFILTNIGFMILAGVALTTVLLFFIFHAIPFIGDFISEVVNYVFKTILLFVEFINSLPYPVAKGFTPHILLVLLTYVLIAFLIYSLKQRRISLFRTSLMSLLVCTLFFVGNRFQNLHKNELVVLNSSQPTVFLKYNHKTIVFSTNNHNSYDEDNYKRKYGGRTDFFELPHKKETSIYSLNDKETLRISNNSSHYKFEFDKHKIIVPVWNFSSDDFEDEIVITGSFTRNYTGDSYFDTREGAFRLSF